MQNFRDLRKGFSVYHWRCPRWGSDPQVSPPHRPPFCHLKCVRTFQIQPRVTIQGGTELRQGVRKVCPADRGSAPTRESELPQIVFGRTTKRPTWMSLRHSRCSFNPARRRHFMIDKYKTKL